MQENGLRITHQNPPIAHLKYVCLISLSGKDLQNIPEFAWGKATVGVPKSIILRRVSIDGSYQSTD